MSSITQITEWESSKVRLVRLAGIAQNPNYPYNWRKSSAYRSMEGRRVRKVFVHQTAGPSRDGIEAVTQLASWITRAPKFKLDSGGRIVTRKVRGKDKPIRVGGGRGFPAVPYTFVVPTRPEMQDGRFVVYRCNNDDMVTWHTKGHNRTAVGVAFCGNFATRHSSGGSTRGVDDTALEAGTSLILDYLLPRYSLTEKDLRGHFDAGKAACPGDQLEAWVREQRGEFVNWDTAGKADERSLRTWEERQAALASLGFDVGAIDGIWGFATRSGLEAFQEHAGLVSDGVWGPLTEARLRVALAAAVS